MCGHLQSLFKFRLLFTYFALFLNSTPSEAGAVLQQTTPHHVTTSHGLRFDELPVLPDLDLEPQKSKVLREESFSFSTKSVLGDYNCAPRRLDDSFVHVCSEVDSNLILELDPTINACKIIPYEHPVSDGSFPIEPHSPLSRPNLKDIHIGVKICEALGLSTQYVIRLNPFSEIINGYNDGASLKSLQFEQARRYVYPVGTESPAVAIKPESYERTTLDISFDAGIHSVPVTSSATWNGISWKDDGDMDELYNNALHYYESLRISRSQANEIKRLWGQYPSLLANCHESVLVSHCLQNLPPEPAIAHAFRKFIFDHMVIPKGVDRCFNNLTPHSDLFPQGYGPEGQSYWRGRRYHSTDRADSFYSNVYQDLLQYLDSTSLWKGLVEVLTPPLSTSPHSEAFMNGTVYWIDATTSPAFWKGALKIDNEKRVNYHLLSSLGRVFVRQVVTSQEPKERNVAPMPSMTAELQGVPPVHHNFPLSSTEVEVKAGLKHYTREELLYSYQNAETQVAFPEKRRESFFQVAFGDNPVSVAFRISGVPDRSSNRQLKNLCFKCKNGSTWPNGTNSPPWISPYRCEVSFLSEGEGCDELHHGRSKPEKLLGLEFENTDPYRCEISYVGDDSLTGALKMSGGLLVKMAIGFCRIQGFRSVSLQDGAFTTEVRGTTTNLSILKATVKGETFYGSYGLMPSSTSVFSNNRNYTAAGLVSHEGPSIPAVVRLENEVIANNAMSREQALFFLNAATATLYDLKIDCKDRTWLNCDSIFPQMALSGGRCAFQNDSMFQALSELPECKLGQRVGGCLKALRKQATSSQQLIKWFVSTFLWPADPKNEFKENAMAKSAAIVDQLSKDLKGRLFGLILPQWSDERKEAARFLRAAVVFVSVGSTTTFWTNTFHEQNRCEPAWAHHYIRTAGLYKERVLVH